LTTTEALVIVGLGNPGREYRNSRHNLGFQVVERLAEAEGIDLAREKFQGRYGSGRIAGRKVYLLQPLTFMNRSGTCVAAFLRYFSLSPERLLVIHDDLDQRCGRVKVVRRGGAGGHNGIRSLIAHLHTQDFARIKIGIGRPGRDGVPDRLPVERFVLAEPSPDEERRLATGRRLAVEGARRWVEAGVEAAMAHVHREVRAEDGRTA